MIPNVELYSACACPYAQQSKIVLLEKGIDFNAIEIDLQNKPEWFAQISPYGNVPVLLCGDDRIWESTIINEYLEEQFPATPLMPEEPGLRAIARIWIDFATTQFIPSFHNLLLSQDPENQEKWLHNLQRHFQFMEIEGLGKWSVDGPYWLGECLSLVDLTFYPWFERMPALDHYRGAALPVDCIRLREWWITMQLRDSVRATTKSTEFYVEQFVQYASS